MSLDVTINLHSLNLVKEELDNSITQAGNEFEAFLANQSDLGHVEQARDSIAQVAGTFKLLQFPGAALLADEMAAVLDTIASAEAKATDAMLTSVTHNLFVLPRYIEYIGIRQKALPILLIPYINELRAANRRSLLPEYHFQSFDITATASLPEGEPAIAELLGSAKRLRHMYQVGLLGLINEKNPSPYFAELIKRAVARVDSLLVGHPGREIWYLAKGFADCLTDKLELTLNRKRALSAIERLLRQIVSQGEQGITTDFSSLKHDLLFAIALSPSTKSTVIGIKEAYGINDFGMTDADLIAEREKMYGPSLDTMESVVKVIKEELRHTKDILEIASQNNAIQEDDHKTLLEIVNRIADTLSILNLTGPMDILRQESADMAGWISQADQVSANTFLKAADALLFVEGALSSLERREVSVEELNNADEATRHRIIAESHLAEAQRVVLEEAEAGIALSKRAISSYVESNFDSGHIANIAVTLNTIRGGLNALNYHRAAEILASCGAFIDSHIKTKNGSEQRHQLLETLADALISMEYYLAEVASGNKVNEKILDVAEESLAALGFSVKETA